MTPAPGYASPVAFRRALTDRLRVLAAEGLWTLPQLQRQIAYDRLLTRLYEAEEGWIVKGATALLARQIGVRGTLDIDLFLDSAREDAVAELRRAAAVDLGDWFRFEVGVTRPSAAETAGSRVPVAAFIGTTRWSAFSVDVFGADLRMTGIPDHVEPLVRIEMADIEQPGYRAYPLVDHVADKVVATFQCYGAARSPSTRYKDLVDLVAITRSVSLDADEQGVALRSEADRRGVELPTSFAVPDSALWTPGYAKAARDARLGDTPTLAGALAAVSPFLDPLLDGTAVGRWSPERSTWMPS